MGGIWVGKALLGLGWPVESPVSVCEVLNPESRVTLEFIFRLSSRLARMPALSSCLGLAPIS